MITLKNIHKQFGTNKVLKGIDLEFKDSGITAILGPNGSGKTTLIKSILGMVIPDEGIIEIQDKDIKNEYLYRNQIDYLPQIARFPENLKVSELFEFVQDLRNSEANSQKLIELFDLQEFLDKKLGTLSGGTRQKVNIIQALMFDNPFMILDEPTSGLDPLSLIRLKKLIRTEKKQGKTILFTTHIMSLVEELAERIVYILDGEIYFDGTVETLKNKFKSKDLEHAIAEILKPRQANFSNNGNSENQSKIDYQIIQAS
jgi:Cu-processing system ATP-binding protein